MLISKDRKNIMVVEGKIGSCPKAATGVINPFRQQPKYHENYYHFDCNGGFDRWHHVGRRRLADEY